MSSKTATEKRFSEADLAPLGNAVRRAWSTSLSKKKPLRNATFQKSFSS